MKQRAYRGGIRWFASRRAYDLLRWAEMLRLGLVYLAIMTLGRIVMTGTGTTTLIVLVVAWCSLKAVQWSFRPRTEHTREP
jgi:hypothetical protein